MAGLLYLIPIALFLGLLGLAAFMWALRSGQFDDLDGAAERILFDDEDDGPPALSAVCRAQARRLGQCRPPRFAHCPSARPRGSLMAADPVLEPFQLKHLRLKNRVMSTAHAPSYVEDGKPKQRYRLYHEEKAKGGLALTMFGGSTTTAPDSPSAFGQINAASDEIIPWFQQLADAVHRHDCALMCQITHMGRRTCDDVADWLPTLAPSPVRERQHRSFPKTIELHEIKRVLAGYAAGARRCKEGGLDGVEVIAWGHLVDQFLSPAINRRTDDYGGSVENRCRFALEVFGAIRDAVGPEFVVGIRMTGDEHVRPAATLTSARRSRAFSPAAG